MSTLKLFNSLTKKVEPFNPIDPKQVGMYTCGPTVYDYQHIGNFRTMVFSDILRRALLINGYNVKSIRNITDIDDKIIKNANEKDLSIEEFSREYTQIFFKDLLKLNVLPDDNNPKATEHINKMIKYIEDLIQKGVAYEKDGSIYYDISKFPEYGKLSQIEKKDLKTGTRILSDEYSKDNIQDFALWKAVEPNEPVGYDSPWGRGRPGWHIECSVMSQEYLGDTFDIHAGGVDLLFPHHENEIAQSEAKTGKKFVNYFIHGEFILVDGKKMSKSLKNFFTLKDLEQKGFSPLSYRYLILTAHYRDKLNFTWESLNAAQTAYYKLIETIRDWDQPAGEQSAFYQQFKQAINDDLNTAKAIAIMWEMVKSDHLTSAQKAADLLAMDLLFGLNIHDHLGQTIVVPSNIKTLISQREEARIAKNFERSDQLRKEIKLLGYEIEDTPNGPKLKKL